MKIRNDFVTNSSSSSYIIGFKPEFTLGDNDNCFKKIVWDILLEEGVGETSEGRLFILQTDFEKYFVERYRFHKTDTLEDVLEDDYVKEIYDIALSYFNKGLYVFLKEVDYHYGDEVKQIIQGLKDENGIEFENIN